MLVKKNSGAILFLFFGILWGGCFLGTGRQTSAQLENRLRLDQKGKSVPVSWKRVVLNAEDNPWARTSTKHFSTIWSKKLSTPWQIVAGEAKKARKDTAFRQKSLTKEETPKKSFFVVTAVLVWRTASSIMKANSELEGWGKFNSLWRLVLTAPDTLKHSACLAFNIGWEIGKRLIGGASVFARKVGNRNNHSRIREWATNPMSTGQLLA